VFKFFETQRSKLFQLASSNQESLVIFTHGILFATSIKPFIHFIAKFVAFFTATATLSAIPLNTPTSHSAIPTNASPMVSAHNIQICPMVLKIQTVIVFKIFHQSQILLNQAMKISIIAHITTTTIFTSDFNIVAINCTQTQNHCTTFIKTSAVPCNLSFV
jgi:hypothetical protein